MVVEWTLKQCGVALVLGFLISIQKLQQDSVSIKIYFISSLESKILTWSFSDGNGFKTSSMRLGADVVVFSRSMVDRFLCFLCLRVIFSISLHGHSSFVGLFVQKISRTLFVYMYICFFSTLETDLMVTTSFLKGLDLVYLSRYKFLGNGVSRNLILIYCPFIR